MGMNRIDHELNQVIVPRAKTLPAEPATLRPLEPLAPRQLEAWLAIRDHVEGRRLPPSLHELAGVLGCSLNAAWELTDALVRKGHVTRAAGRSRTLQPATNGLPLQVRTASGATLRWVPISKT